MTGPGSSLPELELLPARGGAGALPCASPESDRKSHPLADSGGREIGLAGSSEEGAWIHVYGTATYVLRPGSDRIVAVPEAGADKAEIADRWHRLALPLLLQAAGLEVLHASAVRTERGIVALCGHAGVGKSTLACGLGRRGYPPVADDALAFRVAQDQGVVGVPLPCRLRPRGDGGGYVSPDRHAPGGRPSPPLDELPRAGPTAPLVTVLVLDRESPAAARAAFEIERLPPVAGFLSLLAHAWCFDPADFDRMREMMWGYLELAARTPIWRAQLPDGSRHLRPVLARLENWLRG